MKKIFLYSALCGLALTTACTKLDVKVESEYVKDNFPTTPEGFIAASGPIYSQLATSFAIDYWRLQELSTDEAIIPARDGNYDDGGQYRFLHLHTYTQDHPTVRSVWQWGFGGINACNRIYELFQAAPESDSKPGALADIRAMRALYYYFMMDLYANIPLITKFKTTELPKQSNRAEIFAFIESELKAVLPILSSTTGQITYSRPTKWLAFAILQKMYLNAQVYIGKNMYTESVAMGDSILASNKFSLTSDYVSIFAPDNGPQITETIFAIPYDANVIEGNQFGRFGLHTGLQAKYQLPFRPSIAMSTIASFYQKFNLPGDVRNATWLAGKQYNFDGTPILISTTKKGLDDTYTGSDGATTIKWQLEFSPEMPLKKVETMDVGNDELGKARGVRSIKYYPDKNTNPSTRNSNNDVPVFRLADVMLMKAEAILRGAAATTVAGELQTADVLVNKIRTRAKTTLVSGINLDELLEERAREMAWEAWRRNDMIRFGKYEGQWGFKTDADIRKRIYPIPATEITLNGNLTQNEGYK
ncbi:RagB/SusD family nutrient uptake outer membrane protein [Chitinophaga sp. Cy-1792]|uniref:RagB/SusD family nutrient uptake outer membrane protein n=1 Tax=Chitinophaga sp. Cy-1792 TaxID=2608339 RepID=UPI00141D95B3|nr:RagB/SusD family nutrient uptake outer membrane protein [Chitinophaga sp. Cy-1792]NIG54115.1 RagB/SusD family nutrient uptake outer membrane protein [Chitinophaga sp. Cy-1792]